MRWAAVSRALCVPELLTSIFDYLERPNICACLLVNKQWSEVALDLLWHDVDDPLALFSNLAPLKTGPEPGSLALEFYRTPTPSDWARFHRYASRVRSLAVCTGGTGSHRRATLSSNAWDDIARTRTSLNIFPSLNRLSLAAKRTAHLRDFVTLMQPNIKHLNMKLRNPAFEEEDLGSVPYGLFFQNIGTRMPNLLSLNVSVFSYFPLSIIEEDFIELLSKLRRLEKVVLPIYWVSSRVVSELSRLPYLKVLQFEHFPEQGYGDASDCSPFSPALEEDAFASLVDFSLAVSLSDITKLLSNPFSPREVTDLYIQALDIEGPDPLHDFFAALPNAMPSLAHLYMELRPRERPEDDVVDLLTLYTPNLLNNRITVDTLRPLFACARLCHFELTHDLPIRLSLDDVEELAKGFGSQLTSCLLNSEPFYLERPTLTLAALLPFARHCPKLEHLHLYVDATRLEELPTPPPPYSLDDDESWPTFGPSLDALGFGVSPIVDSHAVARFLSTLVTPPPTAATAVDSTERGSGPKTCGIMSGFTWEWHHELPLSCPDVMGPDDLRDRLDAWKNVDAVVTLCCDLRREEGVRTFKLVEEVKDLRERVAVAEALR
ncbi:hypothetical protein PUNSTDRAFT_127250 [Punctularia strigosozonata HHB-11173 SS5]|uniref:uncharacterized protein n=1 Tax=Punctularia strigosozonata (strain HHB-11173) TaxID=741275 RepID=UPI0004416503|nr:uncharacterized protein PUNSTDRAFT_127250 [Punctularia strigosozonata HHB-11173 SS5]EIN06479.1 hypothetical protein PUNSTDRAFT_127250 [Punctularia strigosozonata HHB-11173 SS5]